MNKYKITMVSGKEHIFTEERSLKDLSRDIFVYDAIEIDKACVISSHIESIETLPDFETGGIVHPKDGQRITVGE
jgi:hypothetical protein